MNADDRAWENIQVIKARQRKAERIEEMLRCMVVLVENAVEPHTEGDDEKTKALASFSQQCRELLERIDAGKGVEDDEPTE